MRRLAIVFCLGLATLSPVEAQRAPAAIAAETGGTACDAPGGRGQWFGHFVGSSGSGTTDHRVSVNVTACFASERQCRRFIYEMRGAYDLGEEIAVCRPRG